MTNAERTEKLINGIYDGLKDPKIASGVAQQNIDQIQDAVLMDIAASLANIADNLTAINDKASYYMHQNFNE